MKFIIIVAIDKNGGIGYQGKLPWGKIKEDLIFFRNTTSTTKDPEKKNCIIMGRKTWESLPTRPLPNRINIVMSTNKEYNDPVANFIANSKQEVIDYVNNNTDIETTYIIGGAEIYNLFVNNVNDIIVTFIKNKYKCDKFFSFEEMKKKFDIKEELKISPQFNIVYLVRKTN